MGRTNLVVLSTAAAPLPICKKLKAAPAPSLF